MTYKLLLATSDLIDWLKQCSYHIEYKDLVLSYRKISDGTIFLYHYCSTNIWFKSVIGMDITHLGIPENLKNYIEDPLFEIELEKYITSGRF